jgi:hypothetical protein
VWLGLAPALLGNLERTALETLGNFKSSATVPLAAGTLLTISPALKSFRMWLSRSCNSQGRGNRPDYRASILEPANERGIILTPDSGGAYLVGCAAFS